jgi:primary-amine oxidase
VVNLVRYQDGAKLRSVMYEGSFSEMYVPYMDVDEGWNSRSFLDAGEFLHDGLLKAIDTDDCPANAEYFAGLAPDERGRPILRTKVACLFERTKGDPAWRHLENNILAGRPSRELVLRTVAEIGNYDYVMDWVGTAEDQRPDPHQYLDGSIFGGQNREPGHSGHRYA